MSRWSIALGCMAGSAAALAHDPGLSTTQITVSAAGLHVTVGYSPADLRPLLGSAGKNTTDWTREDFVVREPQLRGLAPQLWKVACRGVVIAPDAIREELTASNTISFDLHFTVPAAGKLTVESGVMERLPPGHRDYLSVADDRGALLLERLVDAQSVKIALRN